MRKKETLRSTESDAIEMKHALRRVLDVAVSKHIIEFGRRCCLLAFASLVFVTALLLGAASAVCLLHVVGVEDRVALTNNARCPQLCASCTGLPTSNPDLLYL